MAESGGLPSWVEAWVGKVVQVYVHGEGIGDLAPRFRIETCPCRLSPPMMSPMPQSL